MLLLMSMIVQEGWTGSQVGEIEEPVSEVVIPQPQPEPTEARLEDIEEMSAP